MAGGRDAVLPGSDGQSVTINLSNDSKVKTVDFWQKMIDDDLIDTRPQAGVMIGQEFE
ncbi:MAG: hypothetical protein ACLUB5_01715 [Bifidobacterium dentium]